MDAKGHMHEYTQSDKAMVGNGHVERNERQRMKCLGMQRMFDDRIETNRIGKRK